MDTTRTTSSTKESETTARYVGATSTSPASRMQVARWRSQTGLRRVLNLVGVLLVVVLLVITIASTDDTDTPAAGRGQDPANAQRRSDNSTDQQYESRDPYPGQGADFRGQRLEHPVAVPSYRWQGWDRYREGRCAWIPAGLLAGLGPVGRPRPTSTSCIVSLGDGTNIRITWGPPQSPARWAPEGSYDAMGKASRSRRRAEVTMIAGLEAHLTRPIFLFIFFPGLCLIDLNTGSVTGLSILAWRPHPQGNRCQIAETAATLIAHARVPAAGGMPWNDTPQQPTITSLAGNGPCELLSTSITRLNGLDGLDADRISISDSEHTEGECELTEPGTQVRAWMTSISDTATNARDTPAEHKTDGQPRQLGSLRAYQQRRSKSCAVQTELLPGYTLGVSYEVTKSASTICSLAEIIAATAVQNVLDRS